MKRESEKPSIATFPNRRLLNYAIFLFYLFHSSDLNECLRESYYCHQFAACTNVRGSYSCKCNSAYIGDGYDCYYSYARGKSYYFAMLMLTLFSLATSTLLILAGTLSLHHIYRHYLFFRLSVCVFGWLVCIWE